MNVNTGIKQALILAIGIIADAAEDHRASSKNEPRTIYGKLIAESSPPMPPAWRSISSPPTRS